MEGTRSFAVEQCSHDWIICLDDDELLSPEAIRFIQDELRTPHFDIYCLLQLDHILGAHDRTAYNGAECKPKFFRRGMVAYTSTVHAGIVVEGTARRWIAEPDSNVAIYHLSHSSVSSWLDKANRYTSQPDRMVVITTDASLMRFAYRALAAWDKEHSAGSYGEACSVLRALYDIIDQLKLWEGRRGLDSEAEFARICADLDRQYIDMGIVHGRACRPEGIRQLATADDR